MRVGRKGMVAGVGALLLAAASLAEPTPGRAQALKALNHPDVDQRFAAVERLGQIGAMTDVQALALRLRDDNPHVREAAALSMAQVWSRPGDAAIDRLFRRGTEQMRGDDLAAALATFSEIVRRKPAFAEGWNQRATVLFRMGRWRESLADCERVLERNRLHFGALSGMTQIHLQLDDPQRALQAWQRALMVHPYLDGGAQVLEILDDAVRQRLRLRS